MTGQALFIVRSRWYAGGPAPGDTRAEYSDTYQEPLDGLSRERAMREAREIAKAYSANPVFIGAAVLEVEVKSEVEV